MFWRNEIVIEKINILRIFVVAIIRFYKMLFVFIKTSFAFVTCAKPMETSLEFIVIYLCLHEKGLRETA